MRKTEVAIKQEINKLEDAIHTRALPLKVRDEIRIAVEALQWVIQKGARPLSHTIKHPFTGE